MRKFVVPSLSFVCVLLLVAGSIVVAVHASDDRAAGLINARVVCKNNPEQTYALYLPSNYSPDRRWPLIAAFDPGARGNVPVERFKEAAERYGFIVCGSNNSRNGPMRPSAGAATAMLTDVTERFAIDDKRVYLAGFSGGARVATAIAVKLSGRVAGVIGCGAGFAEGIASSASLGFAYYGTVGTEDFNYPEMKRLERSLEQARVTHHLEVFDGGHDWASSELCVEAVQWIELQAMKSGRRNRDDAFIDRLLKSALARATASETAGDSYDAYLAYASLAADFRGLRNTAEVAKKVSELRDSKAVKQALAKERDREGEQGRRLREIFTLRAKLRSQAINAELGQEVAVSVIPQRPGTGVGDEPPTRFSVIADLKQILAELKRKSEAKENSPERSLARRVLNQFLVSSFEESRMLLQAKKCDLAASNLATDAELMPDNWRILYNLACAYALGGNKRRAVESLNKAVEKGFANKALLESDSQLDAIREEAGFKRIRDSLNQRQ